MGARSRRKGIVGEREACEALADVWPGLQRVYGQARANSASPDIDGPGCPVFIEVKRQESINVHAAMAQATKAAFGTLASRPPVIVHKRSRGEWLVTMRACDLARLMNRARDFVELMGQRAAKPRCVFNQPGACANCSEVGEGCAMRKLEVK